MSDDFIIFKGITILMEKEHGTWHFAGLIKCGFGGLITAYSFLCSSGPS